MTGPIRELRRRPSRPAARPSAAHPEQVSRQAPGPERQPDTRLARAERLGHRPWHLGMEPRSEHRADPERLQRQPEIESTEDELGESVVAGMNRVETDPVSAKKGVFYSHNYEPRAKKGQLYNQDQATYAQYKRYKAYADFWKDDYRKGYADERYWNRTGHMSWELKDNVSAAEAIKAWLKGVTIAECFTTLMAIETDTLRKALGDENFDYLYGTLPTSEGSKRLKVGFPGKNSVTDILGSSERAKKAQQEKLEAKPHSKETAGTPGKRPLKKGEWVYFYNHPMYLLKHPGGALQGENALYIGDRKSDGAQIFSGFGLSNKTEEEMYTTLISAYDDDRDESDYRDLIEDHASGVQDLPENSGKSWQELYEKYKDRIPNKYREDGGVFPDKVTTIKALLEAPAYKIGNTTRQGGFVPASGQVLDAGKLKTTVLDTTKARLTAVDYNAKAADDLVTDYLTVARMAGTEIRVTDRTNTLKRITDALERKFERKTGAGVVFYDQLKQKARNHFDLLDLVESMKTILEPRKFKVRVVLHAGYTFGESIYVRVTSAANTEGQQSAPVKMRQLNDWQEGVFNLSDLVDFDGAGIGALMTVRLMKSPALGSDTQLRTVSWDPKSDASITSKVGGSDYVISVYYTYT